MKQGAESLVVQASGNRLDETLEEMAFMVL